MLSNITNKYCSIEWNSIKNVVWSNIKHCTCERWFRRFQSVNFEVADKEHWKLQKFCVNEYLVEIRQLDPFTICIRNYYVRSFEYVPKCHWPQKSSIRETSACCVAGDKLLEVSVLPVRTLRSKQERGLRVEIQLYVNYFQSQLWLILTYSLKGLIANQSINTAVFL